MRIAKDIKEAIQAKISFSSPCYMILEHSISSFNMYQLQLFVHFFFLLECELHENKTSGNLVYWYIAT